MKLLNVLVILFVLTACSRAKIHENNLTPTDKEDSIESVLSTINPTDTLSYIGYIGKFQDNNSFYTDLFFGDTFDYDLYDEITKMGEQVIFKDEETKRTRIEIEKAGQYFNLTGLSNISIYDISNLKLSSGKLSHIEYVEDLIESRFVAVFEVDNPNISNYLFCIGNMKGDMETIKFYPYKNEELGLEIIDQLKLNKDHIWSIVHYKLNDNVVYSAVSADTTAYIIETTEKTPLVLYKSSSSEAINGLTMISKKINGRQILLTVCGMPETDMTWTSVLIFNGSEYEVNKGHRIRD